MSIAGTTAITELWAKVKSWASSTFYPKTGGTVSGSITSTGEVTATEGTGNDAVTHNLTEKLDEEDYLGGLTWNVLKAKFTWDELAGNTSQDMTTPNLGLSKPARLSTTAINGDMDILDSVIGTVNVGTDGSLQAQVTGLKNAASSKIGTESTALGDAGRVVRIYYNPPYGLVFDTADNNVRYIPNSYIV